MNVIYYHYEYTLLPYDDPLIELLLLSDITKYQILAQLYHNHKYITITSHLDISPEMYDQE